MAESKELKSLLMKVKEESKKVELTINILKTKIMASSPITSWHIDGETMEKVRDFIFGGSKITADGYCSHEIKIHLLLGRKVMTNVDSIFLGYKITTDGYWNHEIKRSLLLGRKIMTTLDGILKSRDITLPKYVHPVKAMVFPLVMYGCESWTVKTAEPQRIDAFELWCWRRLLRVPSTARRSQQSIWKEISPED